MQKVFNLTNKFIILATPLMLFSLISGIYMAISATGKFINIMFALFLLILMTSAFVAGWFSMIKKAISDSKMKDPTSLIKDFPAGVGEYFLSSLGAVFIVLLFSFLMALVSYYIGMKYIGDTGITASVLSKALESTEALKLFVSNLTSEQLLKLNQWNMLIMGSTALTAFLLIFYMPVLFFINKNPLVAFAVALKDLFSRKFFKTLGIYFLIFVINFVISILSALFVSNVFIHFFVTLLNFYFITAVGVGLFYYYNKDFIESRLGQNIDEIV